MVVFDTIIFNFWRNNMNKERIKTSVHDFIFSLGCLSLLLIGMWSSGYIGGVFTWTGSKEEGRYALANMQPAGQIDKNGNFKAYKEAR